MQAHAPEIEKRVKDKLRPLFLNKDRLMNKNIGSIGYWQPTKKPLHQIVRWYNSLISEGFDGI